MKTILIFIFLFILPGCSIQDLLVFNGEEKNCIEGIVLDTDGSPIPNIPGRIISYTSTDCPLIHSFTTDAVGRFNACFDSATSDFYMININDAPIFRGQCQLLDKKIIQKNQNYGNKIIYATKDRFNDFTFVLEGEEATLKPSSHLTLSVKTVAGSLQLTVSYSGDIDTTSSVTNYQYFILSQGIYHYDLERESKLEFVSDLDTFIISMDSDSVYYTLMK